MIMCLGFIGILAYIFYREKRICLSRFVEAIIFFSLLSILSYISILYFPLNNDEIVYTLCGPDSTILTCPDLEYNYFVKFTRIISFLGGKGHYALLGVGYAFLYMACDLTSRTLISQDELRNKVFRISLFCPPIIYLALRPKKEAFIVFLVSLVGYSFSRPKLAKATIMTMISLVILYLMRWQYVLGAIAAIVIYFSVLFLARIEMKSRLKIIASVIIVGSVALFMIREPIMNKVYLHFFPRKNVTNLAARKDGALIYRFMMFDLDQTTLHPLNIFIAHAGGLLTPHPLRVIKEYQRDNIIKPHVLEEFLYVTSWLFMLLPFFYLYLKEKVLISFSNENRGVFFQAVFSGAIFSLASMSMLYHTPQHFRYRLPIHLYLFMAVVFYLCELGPSNIWKKIKTEKIRFLMYFTGLSIYCFGYLSIEAS